MQNFLFPSLLELENGIHFFSTKGTRDIHQLQQSVGLWKRLSVMGSFCSYFALSTKWWRDRFLLPLLIESSLHYLEKMRIGAWRRKDEECLRIAATFFLSEEVQKNLQGKASPVMLEFLSGELPSFLQQRELFRTESQQLGLKHENGSWHQNELFSQYCDRMKRRLESTCSQQQPEIVEQKAKHITPMLKKTPLLSEASLCLLKSMKEKNAKLLHEVYDLQQQVLRHKKQSFLLRVEAQKLYEESILLEQRIISLAIALEELATHLPDENMLFLFGTISELETTLRDYEESLQACAEEKDVICSELLLEVADGAKIRKKLLYVLKNLTTRLASIELISEHTSMRELQKKLIAQGQSSITECRNGLTRLPGLLFPLCKIEEYVEDIEQLCRAFSEENNRERSSKK